MESRLMRSVVNSKAPPSEFVVSSKALSPIFDAEECGIVVKRGAGV